MGYKNCGKFIGNVSDSIIFILYAEYFERINKISNMLKSVVHYVFQNTYKVRFRTPSTTTMGKCYRSAILTRSKPRYVKIANISIRKYPRIE